MISVFLPLRITSPLNAREHWTRRAARAKEHRDVTRMLLRAQPHLTRAIQAPYVVVELTRIAPLALDTDNLAAGFKAIRDGVADALGLRDDSDPRVTWAYAQQRGKPKEFACRIVIRADVSSTKEAV